MCLTFIVLTLVIFMLPTRATVRSSIEIGSVAVGDKQEALNPPDNVARQIPGIYGPTALLTMANKGISPPVLGVLQDPSVESIGRFVVIVSTIDPSLAKETREFQEIIADLVIKELAPHEQALRENLAARIALATRALDDLDQQIKLDASEIERINAVTDDLRSQIEQRRASLTALYQRTGTEMQPAESSTLQTQIRQLNEQISSQTNLIGNLALERSDVARELATTRRLRDAQVKAVAEAQFQKNSFSGTHISLPPALMPATESEKRRPRLLLVALVVSLLAGFGTVVLLHNTGVNKV